TVAVSCVLGVGGSGRRPQLTAFADAGQASLVRVVVQPAGVITAFARMPGRPLRTRGAGIEAQRVDRDVGVGHIGVGIGGGGEAERVRTVVAGGGGVVVAVEVVVGAGLGVVVLAGEPERAVGGAGDRRGAAPEGRLVLPGNVAVGRDKFGWGVDEVGDDGVEPPVDHLLRGVAEAGVLGLGERPEGLRCPVPDRGGAGRVGPVVG